MASTGAATPTAAANGTGLSAEDQKNLADFNDIVAAYITYAKQEDDNLAKFKDDQGKALFASGGSRQGFYSTLDKVFSGILGRVNRYDAQLSTDGITTGRRSAMDQLATLMTGLANQKGADAQNAWLSTKISAEKDARMKSLLQSLQKLISAK